MLLFAWFSLFLLVKMDIAVAAKDEKGPMPQIDVLVGETIYLPCNVTTHTKGDSPILILWYRGGEKESVYSIDFRGEAGAKGTQRTNDTLLTNRTYFVFNKQPGELIIEDSVDEDSAVYECRVDFKIEPSRTSFMNLTVITPPYRIFIRDSDGIAKTTVVGPYNVGQNMTVLCVVQGGSPSPAINWSREGVPLVSITVNVPNTDYVQSYMTVGPLVRQDLNTRLKCRATNHPKITPLEAAVQIDMNFAPADARLLGSYQPLSSGRRYDLLCQTNGSRPPAVITWWLNGQRLQSTTETTSTDGNMTTSTLSISFNKSDTGKYLYCRVYNRAIRMEPREAVWKLEIQYVPETVVLLGKSLEPDGIREGTDVYFDCLVNAHPPVYKVDWRRNGLALPQNIAQGVIIANHSLVLQGVSRLTAGNYTCVGFNSEGDGHSTPFVLNVLYAPTCLPNQTRVYGVAKQEEAQIRCDVDANPPNVEFKWTFNNSADSIDMVANQISRSGTSSIATYTPITELDYGTLLCIASNKIGTQRLPCVFHIIAAGRPDQVHNCTLTNISMTSFTVKCNDGFNGGLPQSFMLEVKDLYTYELKANYTSPVPRFAVSSLTPGTSFHLSVYAFNTKGRSDPTNLSASTLRIPEKHLTSEIEKPPRLTLPPGVSLTIGLTAAIVIVGLAIILVLRMPACKRTRRRGRKEVPNENTSRDGSPGPSDKSSGSKEIDGNESDEKNPDIIPETIDSDDQVDYIRRRQHISTIDTSSPTRGLLSSSTPPPQKCNSAGMTLHAAHNALGYCTLRNRAEAPIPVGAVAMNAPPHLYPNTRTSSCTLPRQPNQMWPTYSGAIAGVRHIQPIPVLRPLPQQQFLQPQPAQHPQQQELVPRMAAPALIPMQHLGQIQRARVCVGLSEDEITVQTPLVVKRESTV